jgi:hypothetical protein
MKFISNNQEGAAVIWWIVAGLVAAGGAAVWYFWPPGGPGFTPAACGAGTYQCVSTVRGCEVEICERSDGVWGWRERPNLLKKGRPCNAGPIVTDPRTC